MADCYDTLIQRPDGRWYCPACDPKGRQSLPRRARGRTCDANRPVRRTARKPKRTAGPGTELKALLRKVGITDTGSCKCNQRANLMDEQGPDWCLKNIETIVDWLEAEAGKRKLAKLVFTRLAARQLVRLAIRRARKRQPPVK